MRFLLFNIVLTAFLFVMPLEGIQAGVKPIFSDLPADHPSAIAVQYLVERGIIAGYPDGTFKPDALVNRSEAIKLIVAPINFESELEEEGESSYEDVSPDAWYSPYVERGYKTLEIIDGPPKTTRFYGERAVITAEFLKMLLLAHGAELSRYDDVMQPLAHDVTDAEEWYYPYVRYALTASILDTDGEYGLAPGKKITRADTAQFLYHFLRYKEGNQTQELLDKTEQHILAVLELLTEGEIEKASFASARALLTAAGAYHQQANDPLVQSVMKVAEGFFELVHAYSAGSKGSWNDVIEFSGNAWNKAGEAQYLHSDMKPIATEMMQLAKQMADEARRK